MHAAGGNVRRFAFVVVVVVPLLTPDLGRAGNMLLVSRRRSSNDTGAA